MSDELREVVAAAIFKEMHYPHESLERDLPVYMSTADAVLRCEVSPGVTLGDAVRAYLELKRVAERSEYVAAILAATEAPNAT